MIILTLLVSMVCWYIIPIVVARKVEENIKIRLMKLKRFIDIAVLDADSNPIKFFKVGKVSEDGLPVPREFSAILDVLTHSDFDDIPIEFIPYNI